MARARVASFNDHVAEYWATSDQMAFIEANMITSYEDIYALIKNDAAAPASRIAACNFLDAARQFAGFQRTAFDRRQIVPALLVALKSTDGGVSESALYQLPFWGSKAVVPALIELAMDRTRPDDTRRYAVYALGNIKDERASQPLIQIANDNSEDPGVRGHAIEMLELIVSHDVPAIDNYVRWLSDSSADVRFWAAWALVCNKHSPHIVKAIPELDRVVANDHALPAEHWWHVDREAIAALEGAFYFKVMNDLHLLTDENKHVIGTYLVSASLEYMDYLQTYRHREGDSTPPTIDLRIDLAEFADQLQSHWQGVKINVRAEQLTCYLLDWQIVRGDDVLIGGLPRDQYAMTLTSNNTPSFVEEFAAWVRTVIPKQHTLYLYDWAGGGETL